MNIRFRSAQPSDAEPAAPLMYSSGPDAFNYVFKRHADDDVLEYLRIAFRDDCGELGYGNHVVAEFEGEVVGLGTTFSGQDALNHLTGGMRGLLSYYGLGAPAVAIRALRMESVIKLPKGDLHYVAHLGVTPDLRSHGIGQRLVEHLLDAGRALGRTTAALDVSVHNPRAQALYERLGFRPTRECKSTLRRAHGHVPDHIRMEMKL